MNIFLTALRNLEIVDSGESSFEIMPGINFTNNNLVKAKSTYRHHAKSFKKEEIK